MRPFSQTPAGRTPDGSQDDKMLMFGGNGIRSPLCPRHPHDAERVMPCREWQQYVSGRAERAFGV
jgi:hypothetical protein